MDLKFSLKDMYVIESEVEKLLSTLNMKTFDDISQTNFRNVNKDNVIEFAKSVTVILKRSQELLKHAATDLDTLKCEQLENQSKLLAVQDELTVKKSDQLEAVKSTVDEKLSSWTNVVKKNCTATQSGSLSQKKLKQVVKSAIKDSDRSRNVMMFNIAEERKDDGTSSMNYDTAIVQQVMYSSGLRSPCEISCERIGVPAQGKSRPLRVNLGSESVVSELLSKSKSLKDTSLFMVFVEPDRNREERDERRKLVQELKQKRKDNPDQHFYIRNNKIVPN